MDDRRDRHDRHDNGEEHRMDVEREAGKEASDRRLTCSRRSPDRPRSLIAQTVPATTPMPSA